MNFPVLLLMRSAGVTSPAGYIAGGIIAVLILLYLVYTLMKPEKF